MKALEILEKALEASGGEVWQNPETLHLVGTADFSPRGLVDDTHLLHFDYYALFRVFPPENVEAHRANGKVRVDATHGEEVFFQLKFDGKSSDMLMSDSVGFHHRIYSNFYAANNEPRFVQAHQMRVYFDGIKWIDINWKDCFVNLQLPDALFEP